MDWTPRSIWSNAGAFVAVKDPCAFVAGVDLNGLLKSTLRFAPVSMAFPYIAFPTNILGFPGRAALTGSKKFVFSRDVEESTVYQLMWCSDFYKFV